MKRAFLVILLLVSNQALNGQPVSADYVEIDSVATDNMTRPQAGFGRVYSNGIGGLYYRAVNTASGELRLLADTRKLAIGGTTNEIDVSPTGALNLSQDRSWTVSLPAMIDLGGKTSFEVPNGTSPTTDVFGELAGRKNALGANRGALQFHDGTAETYLVGTQSTDNPANRQFPRFNSGGTITWESLEAADIPSTLNATTFSGKIQFSGTNHVGLDLNSLLTNQEPASPDDGNFWYNDDLDRPRVRANGVTRSLVFKTDGLGVNFQAGELVQGITTNDSVKGVTKVPRSLFLASNGSGEPYWFTGAEGTGLFEDWVAGNPQGATGWASAQSITGGAGTSINSTYADSNHPGVVRLNAGTDATGFCAIHRGLQTMRLNGGPLYWEALIRIEDTSAADPEFDIVAGLGDQTSGAISNGVYFEYDRNATNGRYWRGVCVNGGGTPSADTMAVLVQADLWIKLRIEINTAGSSADFYINGVLRKTISSNLPTGGTAPLLRIVKSVDPIPQAARYFDIDYCSFKKHFRSSR
jgi:hypothetical protein